MTLHKTFSQEVMTLYKSFSQDIMTLQFIVKVVTYMSEKSPDLFVTWPGWEIPCIYISSMEYNELRPASLTPVISNQSMYWFSSCVAGWTNYPTVPCIVEWHVPCSVANPLFCETLVSMLKILLHIDP